MDNLQQNTNQGQHEEVPFGTVHHDLAYIQASASEISHLWTSYLAESMSVVMLKHMVAKSKDPDFHQVLQFALDVSEQRVKSMEELFNTIKHPIPDGFDEKDVNVKAPELFVEAYSVRYTRLMTKNILLNYSVAFTDSSRNDFQNLFSGFIDTSKEVISRAGKVLLAKGLLPKPPFVPIPDGVDYVQDKSYIGSFLGTKRALNAIEITNIFDIMDFKMAVRALKLGFAQVVKEDKLRKHLNRGLKIADKQLEVLGKFLKDEGLPGPEIINFQVTDSKEAPYSDRLMMFHVTASMAYIVSSYGIGLTNTLDKQITFTLSRLMAEILEYVKDGVELLIENGWFEKVPEAANRQKLTH